MQKTYNNKLRIGFAGQTQVLLASPAGHCLDNNDGSTIAIQDLYADMTVQTLQGPKKVRAVLYCHTDRTAGRLMCAMPTGDGSTLLVTPYHFVSLDRGCTWVYPAEQFPPNRYPEMHVPGFTEPVYSVQLAREARNDHPDAHSINVNGVWGVTMGHGLADVRAKEEDIRNHAFWGDHEAVSAGLDELDDGPNGHKIGYGTTLDEDKQSNGFISKLASRGRIC